MKRRIFLGVLTLLAALLLAGCGKSGATTLTGQYVRTDSGQDVLIQMREDTGEAAFLFLTARADMAGSFDDFETGDIVEIKVVLVNYDDTPNHPEVLSCARKEQGAADEVSAEYLAAIQKLDLLNAPE